MYGLVHSSYPVEQLLGACFQIEPSILMELVAGAFRHAPYEIENVLGLAAFLCELSLDTFAISDLLNRPLRRNRCGSRRLVLQSVIVPP
jgi:hypothetical protein